MSNMSESKFIQTEESTCHLIQVPLSCWDVPFLQPLEPTKQNIESRRSQRRDLLWLWVIVCVFMLCMRNMTAHTIHLWPCVCAQIVFVQQWRKRLTAWKLGLCQMSLPSGSPGSCPSWSLFSWYYYKRKKIIIWNNKCRIFPLRQSSNTATTWS